MLTVSNITVRLGGHVILENASAALSSGWRVGLVGRNGAGKSTLLALISGDVHADRGEVTLAGRTRIGMVAQEAPGGDTTPLAVVLAADEERARLLAGLETADDHALGDIHERLAAIGAESAPARAAIILYGLGFDAAMQARALSSFSGGWRMRVALAAALFAEPDLLLLDEPTNHLDLEASLWLESFLKRWPRGLILVSHDRNVLNAVSTHILHLNDGILTLYPGDYDRFERVRAERMEHAAAQVSKQAARAKHLQSFVDRFRATASKATQAQSRLKMLAKLPPVSAVTTESTAAFILPSPARPLPPPLVRLENVSAGYETGKPILKHMNLRLDLDDRIGLLGVNGAGKSTFAKLIAGALDAQSGEMRKDRRLKVGWFHQHQIEAMDPDDTPLEIIRRALPESTESARRARLAQWGLTYQKVDTTVANLSGGERARLLLNLVAMEAPHLLILDEPTNHLDIDSRRALLDALNRYHGAVILITHDRSLMELVADRLWFAGDGTIVPFDGDMDDYAKKVIDRARQAAKGPSQVAQAAAPPPPPKLTARPKIPSGPARRRAEAAEVVLARITDAVAKLDLALTDPAVFAKDPTKAADLGRQRQAAQAKLDQAEKEWLEAVEVYESVKENA